MLEFIKHDGLPYLVSPGGEFFAVRWNDEGFTIGDKVELKINRANTEIFSEVAIKAQCGEHLDSIGTAAEEKPKRSRKAKSGGDNE